MAKIDQPEHRLQHYVSALLDRVVVEPCWHTGIEGATIMFSASPVARMRSEQLRKTRGIKPHHLDLYVYQRPRFCQIELKIKSGLSSGQEQTMTALARNGIPSGVCRSVLDVYRFLNAEGFTLHGNAFNVAHEVEARWRAAQDAADLAKTAPAMPQKARKPRAARTAKPSLAAIARGNRLGSIRP